MITLSRAVGLGAVTLLSDTFPFHTGEKRSPNVELEVILQSMGVRALNGSMEALPIFYEELKANRQEGSV